MSYFWIEFFQSVAILSIVGTFVIGAFEIKDFSKHYRFRPVSGRKTVSLAQIRRSSLRWFALCILWTAVCVSHLVNPNERDPIFWGLLSLFFLAVALLFMQMPRIGRYIRRKRFMLDPQSMVHLSK